MKQKLADFMPSRLFIYYNERVIEGTVDTDSGAKIRDGIKSVAKQGVCPEDDVALRHRQVRRRSRRTTATPRGAALPGRRLPARRRRRSRQMKGCLASGYPFVFGFAVYESFESQEVAQTGVVPMPDAGRAAARRPRRAGGRLRR